MKSETAQNGRGQGNDSIADDEHWILKISSNFWHKTQRR